MPSVSAGLLMVDAQRRVLLVHPGGPFFKRRDAGVWSVPKGLLAPGESLLATALREFSEELGFTPQARQLLSLGHIKQGGGKTVHAWAFRGDWDPTRLSSNAFELEWPPRSGRLQQFPEVDRAEFFDAQTASDKIVAAQRPLIDRALEWTLVW
jgi:predicted NUDIX family NTP pyrophosphohydrolase